MVETQLISRGYSKSAVLAANIATRFRGHLFVDEALRDQAYSVIPCPSRQSRRYPAYIVALMTKTWTSRDMKRCLRSGRDSATRAAILAELADVVFTIERYPNLAYRANQVLQKLATRYRHRVATERWDGPDELPSTVFWSPPAHPEYLSPWWINWRRKAGS